ncbi:hypothetical protein GCM10010508_59890 [Streptomyces naganishii JCM 4654]|uniref:Uncharacterized protein n=1 Tax=Streptomyces naganishii JCM 4654 TaxID=1306179 RepID=A0A918Y929_9ACTN|nr:hypothetical protein GCM10010508_59890 [Streptomyces naganishii JCM 4654]
MKTAAESRVAVVTQLIWAVLLPRLVPIRPRTGTTSVCIIDTTTAARLRTRMTGISCRCRLGDGAAVGDTGALFAAGYRTEARSR